MKNFMSSSTLCYTTCFLLSILIIPSTINAAEDERKMYIIYMGSHLPSGVSPKLFYDNLMTDVLGSAYTKEPSEYLLRTYERSFYGCVAMLTNAESQRIAGIEGVVSVFPNEKLELQTTRSWDFMGFPIDVQRSQIEKDVIIGMIDTGIWPESASFSDEGLSAVPTKWKGVCQTANFTCNKKIIGARFYKADKLFSDNDGPSPRDTSGHGTHTASTVAGALVPKASFFGLGSGIARGGVPAARIAVYKVCWEGEGCSSADILSAFDDAISDGVDIISMSIGRSFAVDYQFDTIAIGAFHAMQHGILASLSAGNNGPSRGTVGNTAPWLMSVAASTTDRKFVTDIRLGNGQVLRGTRSLNTFDLAGKKIPMIYGGDAPNSTFSGAARACESLNRTLVEGKIVVCEGTSARLFGGPLEAGVAGVVFRLNVDAPDRDGSAAYPLPSTIVSSENGDAILSYIFNLSNIDPEGTILRTDTVQNKSAPNVASFSSRGPNLITPTILKPDLSAPGVDILAAFSPEGEVAFDGDTRSVNYHIISGTSMACPHASASAAYVKSFHPNWSPAAIRSALMTTAFPLNSTANSDAELAYGAGHINPKRAVDPGLVYNATEIDYVNFLCSQGYNASQIALISSNNNTICPSNTTGFTGDLNYPSITVATEMRIFDKTFLRKLTSVSEGPNYPYVYNVKVNVASSSQVSVKVEPETLYFTHLGHELSYTIQVKGGFSSLDEVNSASIEWLDGVHKVRTPVVSFQI